MSKAVVVKQTPKVNLDRKRQTFSKEFKLEAVRLLERGEKPAEQLFWLCAAGQLGSPPARQVNLGPRLRGRSTWVPACAGTGLD